MSDLVTIVVKAPNQQIADQIIQCHHSWTIKKLKDYLSEMYPSKPVRIIYSIILHSPCSFVNCARVVSYNHLINFLKLISEIGRTKIDLCGQAVDRFDCVERYSAYI